MGPIALTSGKDCMALFSDKLLAGRVSEIEKTQKTLLDQNKQILAGLAKLNAAPEEDPENDPENPEAPAPAAPPAPEPAQEPAPEPAPEEDPEKKPKAAAPAAPVAPAAPEAPAQANPLEVRVQKLEKELAQAKTKAGIAELAKIGIKPISRIENSPSEAGEETDPVKRTRAAWSKPLIRA